MTLAEMKNETPFEDQRLMPLHKSQPRFSIENIASQLSAGGLPVPAFVRDMSMRTQYWTSWISTTLGRDLSRVFGVGYDSDYAGKLLFEIIRHHEAGVFPTQGELTGDSRKIKKYLKAFRAVFILRMLPCHESGTGKDIFFISDSGLVHSLMNKKISESISETLLKIFLMNEIMARTHYAGQVHRWTYFKSRKGSPVDLVWNNIPIKIVASKNQLGWETRALEGAMQALKSQQAILVAPYDKPDLNFKKGISRVPWGFWS